MSWNGYSSYVCNVSLIKLRTQTHTVLTLKMMTLQRFGFECLTLVLLERNLPKIVFRNFEKELKFILMYDTRKVAFFCSNKDPVSVSLQSQVISQCPRCKAKYIRKADRCLELRLKEHSDFRSSAVGKHLCECEHFHHIVTLFNISVYSNFETFFY